MRLARRSPPERVSARAGDGERPSPSVAAPDAQGAGIHMLDLVTGQRLWHAGHTDSDADLKLASMTRAIPTQIRVIDMNGDGRADRMYASDLGGQLWRFDIINGEVPDRQLRDVAIRLEHFREIVSRVQRMRRDAGLDVTDRIEMQWWSEDREVRAAFTAHHGLIASELLASSISESDTPLPGVIDLGDREIAIEISPVRAGEGR